MSIRHDDEQTESFALGSSVYGGRPTFALVREENANNVTLTLYELLPTEQADARKRRLERRRQQASKTVPFDEVIADGTNHADDWTWDNWVAVKVRCVSGARLRSLLQLLSEVLDETDIKSELVTNTGSSTVLLKEEAGIRLTLGFVGVKPLHRIDRMRALVRGVARMSLEECYYWHSKCRSPNSPNGKKALRTLFTSHL